jgi:hypothetical protein
MADAGIKQTIIKLSELPPTLGNNETLKYTMRYRIVSEDKNRFSHWSPIQEITIENTFSETGFDPNNPENTSIPYNVDINNQAHIASISWTMPALLIINPTEEEKILQAQQAAITEFDVYIQWETDNIFGDWIWVGKSTGTSFSLSYPHGSGAPDSIKFRIQKVTIIKNAFDAATYLISDSNNL